MIEQNLNPYIFQINRELYDEVGRVRNENNRLNEDLEELHEALDKARAEVATLQKQVTGWFITVYFYDIVTLNIYRKITKSTM